MLNGRLRYRAMPYRAILVAAVVVAGLAVTGCTSSKSKRAAPTAPISTSNDIGVNAFLWRASLDTISSMPVNSADPFGGVIITDWHAQPAVPNERFKLNIYILGRALRADGVRVAVFRQVLSAAGWRDAAVPSTTGSSIEDSILTRARQLRRESVTR